jgi:hypothetical protein
MRLTFLALFLFLGVVSYSQKSLDSLARIDTLDIDTKPFKPFKIISINGLSSIPLVFMGFNSHDQVYKEKSGNLELGKIYSDYGVTASVTHYFSKRIGLGIEYVFESNRIHPFYTNPFYTTDYSGCEKEVGNEDDYTNSYMAIRHEAFQVHTHTLMPVIEWSSKRKKALPLRVHNQFGVGFGLTRIAEKDYLYEISWVENRRFTTFEHPGSQQYNAPSGIVYMSTDSTFNYEELYNYKNTYSSIKVMYATHLRFNLSEQLLMNIGFRINFNFNFGGYSGNLDSEDPVEQAYYINREEMLNYIARKRIFSIGALNLGLSYKL